MDNTNERNNKDKPVDVKVRTKHACVYCTKKKIRCSGERPSCQHCRVEGRKCVYIPYRKRVSILYSHYMGMKNQIKDLEDQLAQFRENNTAPTHITIAPMSVSQPNMASDSSFVSGSSDGIVSELAAMQDHKIHVNTSVLPDTLESSMQMKQELQCYGSQCQQLMSELTLKDAYELIDKCHFFLNDIYFPYDVHLMKRKLNHQYSETTRFSRFLIDDRTYFKPLTLLTFALGERYFGKMADVIKPLVLYALLLVTPVINLRSKSDNYLIVSIYTMASFYFRAINKENDAIMYSNLSLQFAAHIKLQLSEELDPFTKEMKARVMWISFGTNRTLSAKMGCPFTLSSSQITRELPALVSYNEDGSIVPETADTNPDKFPNREDFKSYIDLTGVAEHICRVIYSKKSPENLISELRNIIQLLISWNQSLPQHYKMEDAMENRTIKQRRLVSSLHLNYCFCIHLTTIPILYSLVEQKKKYPTKNLDINANLTELITICINSAEMTINILMNCHKDHSIATFGVMDLDYIYSAALSFFMCGDVLDIKAQDNRALLDSCLFLIKEMSMAGNLYAKKEYDKLAYLIEAYRRQNSTVEQIEQVKTANENDASTGDNSTTSNNLWVMDTSVLDTLQGLTDEDLGIWEDGYKNLQELDTYWDKFQRSLFDDSEI